MYNPCELALFTLAIILYTLYKRMSFLIDILDFLTYYLNNKRLYCHFSIMVIIVLK